MFEFAGLVVAVIQLGALAGVIVGIGLLFWCAGGILGAPA